MKGRDLKKYQFPEEAQPSPYLLQMLYKLIVFRKIKRTAVTGGQQSFSENLTWEVSSATVLAANGKQSLEMGTALWSQWLRSGRAPRWTPHGLGLREVPPRPQAGGTQVSLSHSYIHMLSFPWLVKKQVEYSGQTCILRVCIQNPFIIIETIQTLRA